MNQNFAGVGSA